MVRGEGKPSNGRTTTRARSRPSPGRFLSAGMYGIHHRYFCSPEEEVRPALNPFVKISIRLDQKSNPTWRWLAAIVCIDQKRSNLDPKNWASQIPKGAFQTDLPGTLRNWKWTDGDRTQRPPSRSDSRPHNSCVASRKEITSTRGVASENIR